jgi:hypothetical protein
MVAGEITEESVGDDIWCTVKLGSSSLFESSCAFRMGLEALAEMFVAGGI